MSCGSEEKSGNVKSNGKPGDQKYKNLNIMRTYHKAFLWNKKILNLHLKWHILRSYCFIAEVNLKNSLLVKKVFVGYPFINMQRHRMFTRTRSYGTFCKHKGNYNSTPKYKVTVYKYLKFSITFKHLQNHWHCYFIWNTYNV